MGWTGVARGGAIVDGIAKFGAVTEETVIRTIAVVGSIDARIVRVVAVVVRTGKPVVAIDWRAELTIVARMASFYPGTKGTVVAKGIIRRVQTPIIRFIASVVRACDAVKTVNRYTCSACPLAIASLVAVAEYAISAG